MTVSRATATVAPSLDDFFFSIWMAGELGAIETRKTGYVGGCAECDETVELVEDKVARRTSYGTARIWVQRYAHTHSRVCFEAHAERTKSLPSIDPWAR